MRHSLMDGNLKSQHNSPWANIQTLITIEIDICGFFFILCLRIFIFLFLHKSSLLFLLTVSQTIGTTQYIKYLLTQALICIYPKFMFNSVYCLHEG